MTSNSILSTILVRGIQVIAVALILCWFHFVFSASGEKLTVTPPPIIHYHYHFNAPKGTNLPVFKDPHI